MSVQAITWALSFDVKSSTEKAILLVLANYADGDGACWPGQDSIAAQAACSDRTVRAVLTAFEERGVITRSHRQRRDGSRTSDEIRLSGFIQSNRKDLPEGQPERSSARPTGNLCRSNRKSVPIQPEAASGLTTFEPSEEPSGEGRGRGTRLPDGWAPEPVDFLKAIDLIGADRAAAELEKFTDYWRAVPGSKGRKLDWPATYRNWIRRTAESRPRNDRPDPRTAKSDHLAAVRRAMEAACVGTESEHRGDRPPPGPEGGGVAYLPAA